MVHILKGCGNDRLTWCIPSLRPLHIPLLPLEGRMRTPGLSLGCAVAAGERERNGTKYMNKVTTGVHNYIRQEPVIWD